MTVLQNMGKFAEDPNDLQTSSEGRGMHHTGKMVD